MQKSKVLTWDYLRDRIKDRLPHNIYQVWFSELKGEIRENRLLLELPNEFVKNWLRENYHTLLQKLIAEEGLSGYEFLVRNSPQGEQMSLPYNPMDLLGKRLSKKYTLDNFVVGKCNEFAYKVCTRLVEDRPAGYFIYLCGNYGLGKTHLTQAIGNDLINKGCQRVYYFTAQDFLNHLIKHLKAGQIDNFKKNIQNNCDLLLLDGVHFLSGKDFTQTELALLLDYLLDSGKTVVFTSLRLPQELESLDSSLRSRLNASLIVRLNQPDLETRKKIIRFKAKKEGYKFPYEVVDYLARHIRGDIRQLESIVLGLIARAALLNEPISLTLAKELLSEVVLSREDNFELEIILDGVSRFYRLTKDEIFSSSRKKNITLARKTLIYLLKNLAQKSLKDIAKLLHKEHSTVIHHLKSFERRLEEDRSFKFQMEFLFKELSTEFSSHSQESINLDNDSYDLSINAK